MNLSEYYNLYAEALNHLAPGRAIVLHFSPPPNGGLGTVSKALDGALHMFLDPNVSLDCLFDVFLHESAHVIIHGPQLARSRSHLGEGPTLAQVKALPDHHQVEDEADNLAATWRAYAVSHAWRAAAAHPSLQADPTVFYLLALKGY